MIAYNNSSLINKNKSKSYRLVYRFKNFKKFSMIVRGRGKWIPKKKNPRIILKKDIIAQIE